MGYREADMVPETVRWYGPDSGPRFGFGGWSRWSRLAPRSLIALNPASAKPALLPHAIDVTAMFHVNLICLPLACMKRSWIHVAPDQARTGPDRKLLAWQSEVGDLAKWTTYLQNDIKGQRLYLPYP